MVKLSSADVLLQDVNTVAFSGAAAFTSKNVGIGKAVAVSNISASGSQSGNYTLKSSSATAYATVSAKTIVVNAIGIDKVYDGSTKGAVSLLSSDVISGDTVSFASASATFSDKNVANDKALSIAGITLSGKDALNYRANTSASSTADITPLALTVTAAGSSMVYNATLNTLVTLTSSGVVKGDNVSFGNTSALLDTKNVGTGKLVTVSGISALGNDARNYTLRNTDAVAFATVRPMLISVTARGTDKIFDGTTTDTVNLQSTNVIAGDAVVFTSTSAKFATSTIGVNKAVTVSGISATGADATNYKLANKTATTTATISPKL